MNNLAHHRSSLTENRRIKALYIEKRQIKAPKNLSSKKNSYHEKVYEKTAI